MVDPIIPGDKIYTPIWSPGEKRHFALAGLMDLDGDGHSDLRRAEEHHHHQRRRGRLLHRRQGQGQKSRAQMTVNTRYLVLGDAPTEKGQPGPSRSITKMLPRGRRLGVPEDATRRFAPAHGLEERTPIVHYGRGANPRFRGQAGRGVQRKSTGSVSDVYKQREPPRQNGSLVQVQRRRNRHASRLFRHRCHRRSASPRTQSLTRQRYRPTVA